MVSEEKKGGRDWERNEQREARGKWTVARRGQVNHNTPTPLFLVSVASKGFSRRVSLLFAILAERCITVAAKGLIGADCWRESNWVRWEDLEGVRRTARREAIKARHPP